MTNSTRRLEATAYHHCQRGDGDGPGMLAQLIRFGEGSGDVPVVAVFLDGVEQAAMEALLEAPDSGTIPKEVVDALATSGLPAVDLVLLHAAYAATPTYAYWEPAGELLGEVLAVYRPKPPTRICFLGLGQGGAAALRCGLSSPNTVSIGALDARGTREAAVETPRACRRFTPALFAESNWGGGGERPYEPLRWGELRASWNNVAGLSRLAAFTVKALQEARRRPPEARPTPFTRRRGVGGLTCVGEEAFVFGGGNNEVDFAPIPDDPGHATIVSVTSSGERLVVRWQLTKNALFIRVDSPERALRVRLRPGPSPSLRGAARQEKVGGAYSLGRTWGLAHPRGIRDRQPDDDGAAELDVIRGTFENGPLEVTSGPLDFRESRRLEALLLLLSREARKRCDPLALSLARRFHPNARWLAYRWLVQDATGRVRELIEQAPGALLLAADLAHYDAHLEVDALLGQYVAGQSGIDGLIVALCRETSQGKQAAPVTTELMAAAVRAAYPKLSSAGLDWRLFNLEEHPSAGPTETRPGELGC